jgi:nitrite reductase (NADH) small subunit
VLFASATWMARCACWTGRCPHEGGPLGEGSIEGGKLVCPWHAYAFDVTTGSTDEDPGVKAEVLEARVENGELRAKL